MSPPNPHICSLHPPHSFRPQRLLPMAQLAYRRSSQEGGGESVVLVVSTRPAFFPQFRACTRTVQYAPPSHVHIRVHLSGLEKRDSQGRRHSRPGAGESITRLRGEYQPDIAPNLTDTIGTGCRALLICKNRFARDHPMLYALSVLWSGFAVWGVTAVIVRHFRMRECRESQAKCVSLALAESDRHRQLEEAD
jgi:hypothetical protein